MKILLKVPGLTSEQVSSGLRIPPLNVLSVEREEQAQALKTVLEKFGAVCQIEKMSPQSESSENSETPEKTYKSFENVPQKSKTEFGKKRKNGIFSRRNRFRLTFWLMIFAIFIMSGISNTCDNKFESKPKKEQEAKRKSREVVQAAPPPKEASKPSKKEQSKKETKKAAATIAEKNNELKNDLVKNPYNVDAWKNLAENLEKSGDTISAKAARESYEKALRTQMVLSSLAKTFGNNVRVEVMEDAIFYRTSKDLTEEEFYKEAARLRDSLNAKFPGKDLVIENYTPSNKFQNVRIEASNNRARIPDFNY